MPLLGLKALASGELLLEADDQHLWFSLREADREGLVRFVDLPGLVQP